MSLLPDQLTVLNAKLAVLKTELLRLSSMYPSPLGDLALTKRKYNDLSLQRDRLLSRRNANQSNDIRRSWA